MWGRQRVAYKESIVATSIIVAYWQLLPPLFSASSPHSFFDNTIENADGGALGGNSGQQIR